MFKKKNIIIIFSLMLLILIVYGYERTIKPQKTKLLSVDFVPTELYFEQSFSSSIHDKEIINRFYILIKDSIIYYQGRKIYIIFKEDYSNKEVVLIRKLYEILKK